MNAIYFKKRGNRGAGRGTSQLFFSCRMLGIPSQRTVLKRVGHEEDIYISGMYI